MSTIQEIPPYERPRERLKRLGADALRSDELLAVLLGSGSKKDPVLELSKALIREFGSLKGVAAATLEELQAISGIGFAKALKIKAAFELSSRCDCKDDKDYLTIRTPERVYNAVRPFIKNEKRELFLTVLLDVRCMLIEVEVISIGILTTTLVHPREVFFPAIRKKAHAIIAVHNHPSGNLVPSKDDISLTEHLHQASQLMGIPLIDHLIVSSESYYSFKQSGFPFNSKNAYK